MLDRLILWESPLLERLILRESPLLDLMILRKSPLSGVSPRPFLTIVDIRLRGSIASKFSLETYSVPVPWGV